MTDVTPIRTLHGLEAKWALTANPHDPVPQHDGHWVVEKQIDYKWTGPDTTDLYVVIKCSCGQTFSGALR